MQWRWLCQNNSTLGSLLASAILAKKYHSTRHNVGFQIVGALADAEGISISSVSFKALFGEGFIGNVPVMLAKPQTFVNASGVGWPPGKMDTANFVLRPFTKQEREELDFTFQQGIEGLRILLLQGLNKSATFVNSSKSMEQLG